jgi:hypothetical protein
MPQPRWMPLPELLYAPVVKSYRRRRSVGGEAPVVVGTQLAIEQVLAPCGWTSNPAFVERLNLDSRQRVAANRAPGQYAVPGRREVAGSVGALPGLSQLCLAPRQSTPAAAGSRSHYRQGLGQVVAARYTGDGGQIERPRVVAQRSVALPGATMAAAARTVRGLRRQLSYNEAKQVWLRQARRVPREAENLM